MITGISIFVMPNTLDEGRSYQLAAYISTPNSTVGTQKYAFLTNVPPIDGSCSVSPITGILFYDVLCIAWKFTAPLDLNKVSLLVLSVIIFLISNGLTANKKSYSEFLTQSRLRRRNTLHRNLFRLEGMDRRQSKHRTDVRVPRRQESEPVGLR